jgi:DNA-binding FadR family transcriptional regulator
VRVGLGECRRDAQESGCEHHRTRDIPAASQNDVGSSSSENPRTGHWRLKRETEGSNQAKTGLARKALDLELIELEAGLRNQATLNSLCACERHADAARDQRFRDGDRRQDVPGCSSRGDQALERLLRLHGSARC